MAEVNAQKHLVQRTPTPSDVEGWVNAAKKLPQMVTH
jgi:hypothetical protein